MFTNESLIEIASSQLLKSIYSGQVNVLFLVDIIIILIILHMNYKFICRIVKNIT